MSEMDKWCEYIRNNKIMELVEKEMGNELSLVSKLLLISSL